ncbi:dynamin family protein [Rhodoferax antarcticus]|uniref:dynamin family protein n=1 Tax=Rhodoferax antarcticus TaxID=81479 RepID=UPI00222532EB|nr:dynamin family protein [Rhodoferax antarcticus]MCW2313545.1 GTP-binding protein EngB required for normal cell division [Rhodoferax antarcticus]
MTLNNLDPAALQQRYSLLCRALQATPAVDDPQPALATVGQLDDLIHRELLELARHGSPDDFADIYLGFDRELTRFREFCADPRLAEKTVVAFGGPFSAGKSSLINALIGKKLLVVEVDPTTALPAYVLAGEADTVHALNAHRLRVPLTDEEFATLTHDEVHRYGSQVTRALSAAFVTRRDFPWANLAFIDTPGYTGRATGGDRTDADLAATQLGGAHAIVWVASIKQGNLSEEDLVFLARLDPNIPRVVVASHADQLTDSDCAAVIERMRDTLAARNLPVLGVHAVSARPRQAELLTPLRAQLDVWNQTPRQQRFAHRFKALFTRYQRGLEREAAAARWQLHRINRIATLADGDLAADASQLKSVIDERLEALKTVETRLRDLRGRFFGELKRTGNKVGIPLPEPHEVELLEPGHSNLLERLVALREQQGREEPDVRQALSALRDKNKTAHCAPLLRRGSRSHPVNLRELLKPNDAMHGPQLVRRTPSKALAALLPLRKANPTAHHHTLLRRRAQPMSQALNLLQN